MSRLILPLKKLYFDQIKSGEKLVEYRKATPYWSKRLAGKTYDDIVLTLGYPARDDADRRLVRPWRGFKVTTITHPHFGPNMVQVFAIPVHA